jgi:hypothetical protein
MQTENKPTETDRQADDLARTLLVLNNYDWLKDEAKAVGVEIIPIKGIDLLQTVYAEHLDRFVRDIDLLCTSEADCRRLVERLCQEEYRLEFPFSMRPEVLAAKQKVSLLSCSMTKVNVDIHTAFVTKKFFAKTIGAFNADALTRCRKGHMEATDRWLFLAQHAAFHLFSDGKWTRDLMVLLLPLDGTQHITLTEKATLYGFRRVMAAALCHVCKGLPKQGQAALAALKPTASEQRFLSFVRHFDRPFSRHAFDRLIAAYWEFVFIDRRIARLSAWLRLIFPDKGMLSNIYKIKRPLSVLMFYPLNILIVGLTSLVFLSVYCSVTTLSRKSI